MTIAERGLPLRRAGMRRKQRRLLLIALVGAVLTVAVGLILYGLSDRIAFSLTPSGVAEKGIGVGQRIRLGGFVKNGSVVRGDGVTVRFAVTDGTKDLTVTYTGILPDLFREGQGVVTEGVLTPDGLFHADKVLAKHDETYLPREYVEELKAKGLWKGSPTP